MKTTQTGFSQGNTAQRLQSALGAFKPPSSWGGSQNRGIGVVDPDGDRTVERLDDGRVWGGSLPVPTFAPCQTDFATIERISEAPKLNRSINRIKYKSQSNGSSASTYHQPLVAFRALTKAAMISTDSFFCTRIAKSIAVNP